MGLTSLERDGAVFVLRLTGGENQFNPDFIAAVNAALDEVDASDGPAALVTTGGEEKFYSTGFDLNWIFSHQDEAQAMVHASVKLLGRLLAFPVPSVAAINGHAFGIGVLFALAHDWRVMRAERGYVCLPEIDLNLEFQPGMNALLSARLSPTTLRDLALTGRRVGGGEARALGVVDDTVPLDELLARAVERAAAVADKSRATYGALKRGFARDVLAVIDATTS